MEFYLIILVGLIFTASTYMILSKSIIRLILGVALLSHAVNLLIFIAGRITNNIPPIILDDFFNKLNSVSNPVSQALILTAIVISFSLFSFILIFIYKVHEKLGTDDIKKMNISESKNILISKFTY